MYFIDGAPVTAAQATELEAQLSNAGYALLPSLLPLLVAAAALLL